uniref:Uncharacterized protein n=1 Tax=Populus alba TaxID=43335 RepID=A0A4U5Q2F3_POPAL|nr:hypothetical protein D5086_0000161280 [Populus alba]
MGRNRFKPTATFLNGYPLSSELLDWLKGKLYKAFSTRLRIVKERIVALSCLNESTFVDGCFFGIILSIFRTTGSTTPAFSLLNQWNPKVTRPFKLFCPSHLKPFISESGDSRCFI